MRPQADTPGLRGPRRFDPGGVAEGGAALRDRVQRFAPLYRSNTTARLNERRGLRPLRAFPLRAGKGRGNATLEAMPLRWCNLRWIYERSGYVLRGEMGSIRLDSHRRPGQYHPS